MAVRTRKDSLPQEGGDKLTVGGQTEPEDARGIRSFRLGHSVKLNLEMPAPVLSYKGIVRARLLQGDYVGIVGRTGRNAREAALRGEREGRGREGGGGWRGKGGWSGKGTKGGIWQKGA